MPIRPPAESDVRDMGADLYLDLSEREIELYRDLLEERLDAYETVRSYEPALQLGQAVVRERNAGRRVADDTGLNAWVTRCEVRGDDGGARGNDGGALAGWDVAIKDNVCVAGVEMTCGSRVMEGYVPNTDATVVRRLLDDGARIVGKANMDDMAMGIRGYSAFGPIRNPHDRDYLAGGSSGGSAALVANGEVDAAIGTDQGGSVRIPASYCGVVGLKPTYGLVPYTGIVGLSNTVDHPGPMASDVESVAKVLSTIAGGSTTDPRQPDDVRTEAYSDALDGDVDGLTVGVLTEGFDHPEQDSAVNETVRAALDDLEELGATTEEASVPMHADAHDLHSVSMAEGLLAAVRGEGLGHGSKGWYNVSWVESFGKFRRAQGRDFSPAMKLTLLQGQYTSSRYHSTYYGRAMNLLATLASKYDEQLEQYDLLAMPTTVQTAPEYDSDQDGYERARKSNPNLRNTCSFNRTGHPAISVPAGSVNGLPVGVMLVGRRFEDRSVLNAARAIERTRSENE